MTARHRLPVVRELLASLELDGIVIPSTDEFLSEFSPPDTQRLFWTTGFRGSVGTALIMSDRAALFVDGRYRVMAAEELDLAAMDVAGVDQASKAVWLDGRVAGRRIVLDPRLHSANEFAAWKELLAGAGAEVVADEGFPIDAIRPAADAFDRRSCISYDLAFAGASRQSKIGGIARHIRDAGADFLLVADPEDVSSLLNVRSGQLPTIDTPNGWHVVPDCRSRALVSAGGDVLWFVEPEAAASLPRWDRISSVDPSTIEDTLRTACAGRHVLMDLNRTPERLVRWVREAGRVSHDPVAARNRWRKQSAEAGPVRRGHVIDASAVIECIAWLKSAKDVGRISEIEIAAKLEALRRRHPDFRGPSMPAMVAAGRHGALAHYFPSVESSISVGSHPILWIDSGGQYFGCTTDNTVTLSLGQAEQRHLFAHTLVLKGFIALTMARFPQGTSGSQLDTVARHHLWSGGLDYAHGTGHGVGNYLNVHEGPLLSRTADFRAQVELEAGMIVTNEPGYYKEGDFGIRLEAHLLVVPSDRTGFLEFEIISCLPIDPDLVDAALLSAEEARWLADYHRRLRAIYEGQLTQGAWSWLAETAGRFELMEKHRGKASC